MIFAGIDYSMSSPALCILHEESDKFEDARIYFQTKKKKDAIKVQNIKGILLDDWESNEERFDILAENFVNLCVAHKVDFLFIEGYAMGAKGQVFNIGENTGILKHKLFKNKIPFDVESPSRIKKYATGKGNANKLLMYESFLEKTKVDLQQILLKKAENNPISDIVDAYFIAKYAKDFKNNSLII